MSGLAHSVLAGNVRQTGFVNVQSALGPGNRRGYGTTQIVSPAFGSFAPVMPDNCYGKSIQGLFSISGTVDFQIVLGAPFENLGAAFWTTIVIQNSSGTHLSFSSGDFSYAAASAGATWMRGSGSSPLWTADHVRQVIFYR